jgi:hypothetical protein
LKKALKKACDAPKQGAKKFNCWDCKRPKSVKYLATDRQRWPASTCIECAKESMDKHYFNVTSYESIYFCIAYLIPGWWQEDRRAIFDQWYKEEKSTIQKIVETQRFIVFFSRTETRFWIHKSFIKPFIEDIKMKMRQ